jgi:hypothetical protein
MPPGLSLAQSGLVYGTPTQAGDFTAWIELSDEDPPSADWCRQPVGKAQRQMTFHIIPGLVITQRQGSLGGAFANAPYSLQLSATGGGTLTWSVVTGTALPAGLTINPSTGLISGTPTATGDFTFKIQVKDTGTRSDLQTYTLSVVPKLQIAPLKGLAETGNAVNLAPHATGGKAPYKWSLAAGVALPAGLKMDPATGAITGTPTAAGKSPAKLLVTDSLGLTDTLDLPFTVAPHVLLAKKKLPAAHVGGAYDYHLVVIGGFRPRTFALVGGRLPAGLRLNARTGELSGKPKKAGTYRFRIEVTDGLEATSAAGFVLKVSA